MYRLLKPFFFRRQNVKNPGCWTKFSENVDYLGCVTRAVKWVTSSVSEPPASLHHHHHVSHGLNIKHTEGVPAHTLGGAAPPGPSRQHHLPPVGGRPHHLQTRLRALPGEPRHHRLSPSRLAHPDSDRPADLPSHAVLWHEEQQGQLNTFHFLLSTISAFVDILFIILLRKNSIKIPGKRRRSFQPLKDKIDSWLQFCQLVIREKGITCFPSHLLYLTYSSSSSSSPL